MQEFNPRVRHADDAGYHCYYWRSSCSHASAKYIESMLFESSSFARRYAELMEEKIRELLNHLNKCNKPCETDEQEQNK